MSETAPSQLALIIYHLHGLSFATNCLDASRQPPREARMTKRPRSITVISWLFLAAGAIGLGYHATEFKAVRPFQYDVFWVCLVRLLAVFCGAFMLRGSNWARWLLIAWMGYHIGLSALHSLLQLVVHGLLFLVILYFLFRPQASAFFRDTRTRTSPGAMDRFTDSTR
jgi:hypothetical protein